jgi:hypothetical protein
VNTAGRDPLDRVEVGPPVRGEGRLVDRRNIDSVVLLVNAGISLSAVSP